MDFLQLFVDNALTKEAVFFLKNAYFTYMYVPVNIGEGKYIYAAYESNRKDMQNTVNLKTELKIAAFVAKGNVYLVDTGLVDSTKNFMKPNLLFANDIFLFSDKVKEMQKELCEESFPQFYSSLDTGDVQLSEYEYQQAKYEARITQLSLSDKDSENVVMRLDKQESIRFLTEQDFADALLGIKDLKTMVLDYWTENAFSWKKQKAFEDVVNKYISENTCITELEFKFISSIREIPQARAVNMILEKDGKTSVMKADLKELLRRIRIADGKYDITGAVKSRVQRDRVHAELGFGKYDNIPLECVKTVSYGGKVIYER